MLPDAHKFMGTYTFITKAKRHETCVRIMTCKNSLISVAQHLSSLALSSYALATAKGVRLWPGAKDFAYSCTCVAQAFQYFRLFCSVYLSLVYVHL